MNTRIYTVKVELPRDNQRPEFIGLIGNIESDSESGAIRQAIEYTKSNWNFNTVTKEEREQLIYSIKMVK